MEVDQHLSARPTDPEGHHLRGLILLEMERDQQAVAAFDRAIQLKPDMAVAWYDRGNAKYCLQDMRGALSDLEECEQVAGRDFPFQARLQAALNSLRSKNVSETSAPPPTTRMIEGMLAAAGVEIATMTSGPALQTCLGDLRREGVLYVVVDMSKVDSIGSTLLAVLLNAADEFEQARGGIAIAKVVPGVKSLLSSLGMDVFFKIAEDLPAALRALRRGNRAGTR